jgi:hypothetical protein
MPNCIQTPTIDSTATSLADCNAAATSLPECPDLEDVDLRLLIDFFLVLKRWDTVDVARH